MSPIIGIRREDKNQWERRVPLVPADLADLRQRHGLHFLVQPSTIRIHKDDDYRQAGIEVVEDLGPAGLVIAVKEIPVGLLRPGVAYVYFAHVIKGQPYNMPMLRRLLELGCSLVDYEKIADDQGRRLVFFSLHAGHAGMIETLRCLGQRLAAQGRPTPLAEVRHAWQYASLAEAMSHLRALGERIGRDGLGLERPLTIGIAGYGNVARGAQEVLDCLPLVSAPPSRLPEIAAAAGPALVKIVFAEQDMVRPREGGFELQDYYARPERYEGRFEEHLPHLDVLVNTIFWTDRYPRLVTRAWARRNYGPGRRPRLQVIGDISCDIEGSIELTLKATHPDAPCFVYDPARDAAVEGVDGDGPAIMAVDNLPCELPREASQHFSSVLRGMVPALAGAEWALPFSDLNLPPHLKRAVIVHRGELTPAYRYLERHLSA